MNHPFSFTQHELRIPDQHISYRLYRNNENPCRRLVLLHGAGVDGVDTWHAVTAFLSEWDEILVPDLRGCGKTRYPDNTESAFSAAELVQDLEWLVDHIGWTDFDLAGYSLGGMISLLYKRQHSEKVRKQYLLEPALLDRSCAQSAAELAGHYRRVLDGLRLSDPQAGAKQFLDTISPNRKVNPMVEELTISRLTQRSEGFIHAINCVVEALEAYNPEQLIAAQGDVSCLVGALSVDLAHETQRQLAQRLESWHYYMVPGTDHSLPFQKPRQVAKIMNQELIRFI